MVKWARGSWFTVLVLVAVLMTLTFSLPSSPAQVTVAQPAAELQVDLDVKINVLPNDTFLPLAARNHYPDAPMALPVATGANAYARAGSWLRYVVTYENPGSGPSAPVEVTLALPSEVASCDQCNPGWVAAGGQRYMLTDVPLAAGEQRTRQFAARVGELQAPGITELNTQVTLSGGGEVMDAQAITIAATFTLGPTGAHPVGVAVDTDRNLVYVGSATTGQVAVVDPSSSTVGFFSTVGGQALGVAYLNNKIYVTHPDIGRVSVINAATRALITSIDVGAGAQPFGIAAAGGRVYVGLFGTDQVAVIDASNDTLITTSDTGGHPCLVGAFDDRAYVANHSHFSTTAMQAASADPETLRALAQQYAQQNPDDTGVTVVYPDGTTDRVLIGEVGFFGVAVDPTRNLVYITQRDLGHEGLYVLNGADHSLIRHVPLSKPYAVAVNPNTNHVFVVMAQPEVNSLYVFDGDNDYALIRIEDLLQQSLFDGMMNGGQGAAVLNDWVYVANYGDHTMSSFPDGSSTPPEYDPPIGAPFVRAWLYDLQQPGHQYPGLPVGTMEYRPFSQQEFEHGFVGGVMEDVLYFRDAISGTDHIYEFKTFVQMPSSGTAQTIVLNTDNEVSVAANTDLSEKVAYDSTEDAVRFGNYVAPPPDAGPSFFRSYLRFPLGAIPAGSTINSATLQMWVYDERFPGLSLNAGVYRVTGGAWTEAGLKDTSTWEWATLPAFSAAPESSTTLSGLEQWYYWDVTALAQDWVSGGTTNYGLMVSGVPESGVAQAMGARSRAGVYPALGPLLVITYTPSTSSLAPVYDGTQGFWLRFDDTWNPTMPEFTCGDAQPGYLHDYGVRYGFGVVWCTLRFSTDPAFENYKLGWPLGEEHGGAGGNQRFQNGTLFWSPDAGYPNLSGTIYVAYDDGHWHSYPY